MPTRADERSKKRLSVTKQFKKLKSEGPGFEPRKSSPFFGDLNVPLFRADTPGGRTKKGHNCPIIVPLEKKGGLREKSQLQRSSINKPH